MSLSSQDSQVKTFYVQEDVEDGWDQLDASRTPR